MDHAVARFTGSTFSIRDPGVALAKPRSTPGFMLAPASRAQTQISSSRPLRGLKPKLARRHDHSICRGVEINRDLRVAQVRVAAIDNGNDDETLHRQCQSTENVYSSTGTAEPSGAIPINLMR
jgi:hypothetical protein